MNSFGKKFLSVLLVIAFGSVHVMQGMVGGFTAAIGGVRGRVAVETAFNRQIQALKDAGTVQNLTAQDVGQIVAIVRSTPGLRGSEPDLVEQSFRQAITAAQAAARQPKEEPRPVDYSGSGSSLQAPQRIPERTLQPIYHEQHPQSAPIPVLRHEAPVPVQQPLPRVNVRALQHSGAVINGCLQQVTNTCAYHALGFGVCYVTDHDEAMGNQGQFNAIVQPWYQQLGGQENLDTAEIEQILPPEFRGAIIVVNSLTQLEQIMQYRSVPGNFCTFLQRFHGDEEEAPRRVAMVLNPTDQDFDVAPAGFARHWVCVGFDPAQQGFRIFDSAYAERGINEILTRFMAFIDNTPPQQFGYIQELSPLIESSVIRLCEFIPDVNADVPHTFRLIADLIQRNDRDLCEALLGAAELPSGPYQGRSVLDIFRCYEQKMIHDDVFDHAWPQSDVLVPTSAAYRQQLDEFQRSFAQDGPAHDFMEAINTIFNQDSPALLASHMRFADLVPNLDWLGWIAMEPLFEEPRGVLAQAYLLRMPAPQGACVQNCLDLYRMAQFMRQNPQLVQAINDLWMPDVAFELLFGLLSPRPDWQGWAALDPALQNGQNQVLARWLLSACNAPGGGSMAVRDIVGLMSVRNSPVVWQRPVVDALLHDQVVNNGFYALFNACRVIEEIDNERQAGFLTSGVRPDQIPVMLPGIRERFDMEAGAFFTKDALNEMVRGNGPVMCCASSDELELLARGEREFSGLVHRAFFDGRPVALVFNESGDAEAPHWVAIVLRLFWGERDPVRCMLFDSSDRGRRGPSEVINVAVTRLVHALINAEVWGLPAINAVFPEEKPGRDWWENEAAIRGAVDQINDMFGCHIDRYGDQCGRNRYVQSLLLLRGERIYRVSSSDPRTYQFLSSIERVFRWPQNMSVGGAAEFNDPVMQNVIVDPQDRKLNELRDMILAQCPKDDRNKLDRKVVNVAEWQACGSYDERFDLLRGAARTFPNHMRRFMEQRIDAVGTAAERLQQQSAGEEEVDACPVCFIACDDAYPVVELSCCKNLIHTECFKDYLLKRQAVSVRSELTVDGDVRLIFDHLPQECPLCKRANFVIPIACRFSDAAINNEWVKCVKELREQIRRQEQLVQFYSGLYMAVNKVQRQDQVPVNPLCRYNAFAEEKTNATHQWLAGLLRNFCQQQSNTANVYISGNQPAGVQPQLVPAALAPVYYAQPQPIVQNVVQQRQDLLARIAAIAFNFGGQTPDDLIDVRHTLQHDWEAVVDKVAFIENATLIIALYE